MTHPQAEHVAAIVAEMRDELEHSRYVVEVSVEAFKAWADRLTAALALMERQGWQPIETAPKDGTHIIVCIAGLERSTGESYWWQNEEGRGGWQTWDGENHRRTVYVEQPTHWQPLPPPPKEGEGR